MGYKGYKVVTPSNTEMADFYTNKTNVFDLVENEYLVIQNSNEEVIDKFCYQHNEFKPIRFKTIKSAISGEIKPRNLEQELAFNMLQDEKTKIKVLTGPYGSGKTMSMLAQAIELLNKGVFQKIVYVRNNINVKDTMELGSLPGGVVDKIYPYLMPMVDQLGSQIILDDYIEKGKIEPVHLGFLRGRDLRHSLIYCTEAQNLSVDHMKLLIGRVGEGSELWCDGDFAAQVDRSTFERSNGLHTIVERLSGNEYFGYVRLKKSERSKVAALADLLD